MGKGSLPAPRCLSAGSLPVPISITTGWLHALLPCGVDDAFLCVLLCQYGTRNFVPPLFQNRFIVWNYIYMYVHLYFYIFGNEQLLLTKIVVRTLSDYFRFQPGHLSHSSIYQNCFWFSGHQEFVKSSLGYNWWWPTNAVLDLIVLILFYNVSVSPSVSYMSFILLSGLNRRYASCFSSRKTSRKAEGAFHKLHLVVQSAA